MHRVGQLLYIINDMTEVREQRPGFYKVTYLQAWDPVIFLGESSKPERLQCTGLRSLWCLTRLGVRWVDEDRLCSRHAVAWR